MTSFSRREFLAAATGASAAAIGFNASNSNNRGFETTRTFTTGPGTAIYVQWRVEYNGAVVDSTDTDVDPSLLTENVLPGDSGRHLFRISADTEVEEPIAVTTYPGDGDHVVNAENGRNQPELDAGDTTPDEGELLDAIQARAWYDVGTFGVSFLGGCNGSVDPTEVAVSGSLRDVSTAITDGLRVPESGCLGRDEVVCFGIEWWLDESTGNEIQGDSVHVPLAFTATACDSR